MGLLSIGFLSSGLNPTPRPSRLPMFPDRSNCVLMNSLNTNQTAYRSRVCGAGPDTDSVCKYAGTPPPPHSNTMSLMWKTENEMWELLPFQFPASVYLVSNVVFILALSDSECVYLFHDCITAVLFLCLHYVSWDAVGMLKSSLTPHLCSLVDSVCVSTLPLRPRLASYELFPTAGQRSYLYYH